MAEESVRSFAFSIVLDLVDLVDLILSNLEPTFFIGIVLMLLGLRYRELVTRTYPSLSYI
jgi:hypothetical protein